MSGQHRASLCVKTGTKEVLFVLPHKSRMDSFGRVDNSGATSDHLYNTIRGHYRLHPTVSVWFKPDLFTVRGTACFTQGELLKMTPVLVADDVTLGRKVVKEIEKIAEALRYIQNAETPQMFCTSGKVYQSATKQAVLDAISSAKGHVFFFSACHTVEMKGNSSQNDFYIPFSDDDRLTEGELKHCMSAKGGIVAADSCHGDLYDEMSPSRSDCGEVDTRVKSLFAPLSQDLEPENCELKAGLLKLQRPVLAQSDLPIGIFGLGFNQQQCNLRKQNFEMLAAIQGKEDQYKQLCSDFEALKKENEQLKTEIASKEQEIADLKTAQRSDSQKETEAVTLMWQERQKTLVEEHDKTVENFEKQLSVLKDDWVAASSSAQNLQSQVTQLSAELQTAESQVASLTDEVQSLRDELSHRPQIQELVDKVESQAVTIAKLSTELAEASSFISGVESRLDQLEKLYPVMERIFNMAILTVIQTHISGANVERAFGHALKLLNASGDKIHASAMINEHSTYVACKILRDVQVASTALNAGIPDRAAKFSAELQHDPAGSLVADAAHQSGLAAFHEVPDPGT